MSRALHVLAVTSAACALAAIPSACGKSAEDQVVARVGEATVTRNTLNHWTQIATQAQLPEPYRTWVAGSLLRPQSNSRTGKTLGFLVSSLQIVGDAAEHGIHVSGTEAKSALQRFRYEQLYGPASPPVREAELKRLLSSNRETASDQVWIMQVHMLSAKLEERQQSWAEQSIPYAEVAAYYTQNKTRFVVPERRRVYVIQSFKKPNADRARREIDEGHSLTSVVERRNQEPAVGGVKVLSRDHLDHTYEENYFTAKPHVFMGPLKYEMYYLFEVTKIFPPRQQTLAEVEGKIRHELISGAKRSLLTGLVAASDAKWRARTRCDAAYLLPQCGARLT